MAIEHNHRHVIQSTEADQIEKEIDTRLEMLNLLLNELRLRVKNFFKPQNLIARRWLWLALITLFLFSNLCHRLQRPTPVIHKRI